MNDAEELLPVVDENDEVQGIRRRGDIHSLGLLHRAVHVLVFDAKGRLYLQRRSANKDTHPGKWTTSASGHVDPEENYAEAAARELQEELDLSLALEEAGSIAASPEPRTNSRECSALSPAENPIPIQPKSWKDAGLH